MYYVSIRYAKVEVCAPVCMCREEYLVSFSTITICSTTLFHSLSLERKIRLLPSKI